ncbi:MAG: sulfotransferase [Gammaproteobacteria bacterium]|nr:sulfotransferase [Gammaproteobacteria bacterium]MBP6053703.1 sulfotransferase [Pseudomonadales bacterium]MBK6584293.1 sulfotransferase [Gammaproteobacteria bacterium]MBK7168463.1 sulfotransferase [Gammaproteobacteria bacterium]MBK7520476.1 sulfotransferase [Gammaproteobacteria bacterium]
MSDWTPPARPDWVQQVVDEGRHMDIRSLVPLQAGELMDTARRNTGFDDFGSDEWLEGFHIFLQALEDEADLHLLGRLMTRSDILRWLEARLGIEAAYAQHPEIDEEVIDRPVIVTGLARSGTSILFELLARDGQFGSPRNWEIMFPYPPPETASYETDSRIARCEHLVTQWNRVVPTYASMHEMGASIPNECIVAMSCTFLSENLPGQYQIPSYTAWYYRQDLGYAYSYYRRMLKVLQWKNPRRHWLLKAPTHLGNLPVLFRTFADARVVITHRDPLVAQASVTNLLGTLCWMRSSQPFDAGALESLTAPEAGAARLDSILELLESGQIPTERVHHLLYARLIEQPLEALHTLYADFGSELEPAARKAMQDYLAQKPRGKFGKHRYSVGAAQENARKRALFERYQQTFGVPDEI